MPHEEEMEDLQSDWRRHPATEAFVRRLKKDRDNLVTLIVRAASVSEDAHVRGYAGTLKAIDDVIREVENGQK